MTTAGDSLGLNIATQGLIETMKIYRGRNSMNNEEKLVALEQNYRSNIFVEGVFSIQTSFFGPQLCFKGVSGGMKTEVGIGL